MKLALDIFLIATSLLLMLFILLHRGKGGGLSSLFGGGVQSSLSGSSVVERNLDRVTVVMAVLWVILSVHTYDDLLDLVKFFQPQIFFPYSMTTTILPYLLLWAAYLIRHAGRGEKKYIKKRRIKPG